MINHNIKNIVNVSKTLNEIAISLMNISSFYKDNLECKELTKLLDEALKNQFKDTSLIILNAFKYLIILKNNTFLIERLKEEKIKDKLNDFIITEKDTKLETFAFVILEIIIQLNDSIYNESMEEIYLNFVKSFSKLYIFEKQNLGSNLLEELIKKVFVMKTFEQ